MKDSLWQQAKDIFDEARELSESERPAWLDERCSNNGELRAEVEKLLGSYDSDFLENDALHAAEALIKPAFESGQVIGRYQIRELIGSGGMGQVFLADDKELDRPVAFKVLHHNVAEDQERVRRFIQEARAASALNHPNILTIHEIGSFENLRYIVSEYIDGETLREAMRSGLKFAESVEITCQIATALKAAHAAGIVHRDIKPENIMIRQDGLVKVLDFGLAKLTEADDRPERLRNADFGFGIESSDSSVFSLSDIQRSEILNRHLTAPGLVMGTVTYMSPEQARGQTVDARTDLWSVGVVLHEMLSGRPPFDGENVTELISAILGADNTPIEIENIPAGIRPICERALAKERDSRYQSAHDLLKDLEGEKKRMEYAVDSKKYVTVSSSDERKTQVIGPHRTLSAQYIVYQVNRHKYLTISAFLTVLIVALSLTVYRYNAATQSGDNNGLLPAITSNTTEKDLKMSRLPVSGRVWDMAISPDGKYIAYVTGDTFAKNPIRLRELHSGKETELVPAPAGGKFTGLNFTPDAKYLDYGLVGKGVNMYRVPTSGGAAPVKIVEQSDGGGSVSPDGKYLFFNRYTEQNDSENFIVANFDGTNERVILTTSTDNNKVTSWIECDGTAAWSPDSKKVACERRYKQKNGEEFYKLISMDIADGSETELSDTKWWDITGRVWLTNGDLVIVAKEATSDEQTPFQLWLISPGVPAKQITNGFAGYRGLTATRNGEMLAAIQPSFKNDIWLLPQGDSSQAKQITSSGEVAGGFDFTRDGRIVFASIVSGNQDLWSMNLDGSDRRQLTSNAKNNFAPTVSPDGRYIVFESNRDARFRFDEHIFRMDADGNNVKQLTNGVREWLPRISPDGKWVYYIQVHETGPHTICKVSIDGGQPTVLATVPDEPGLTRTDFIDVSRDGRIAFDFSRWINNDHFERTVYVISPNGGAPIQEVRLPLTATLGGFKWMPDGKSFMFNDSRNGGANNWTILADGTGKEKPLTNFSPGTNAFGFQWSRDGKQLLMGRGTSTSDGILITNPGK